MMLKKKIMKNKKIITLDVNLKSNTFWAASFSFNPFECKDFMYKFFSDAYDDQLTAVIEILQKIMDWRTWETDSIVLFPYNLINADWSALFCNYAKKTSSGKLQFSMCGPIEGWSLHPVDLSIVLYLETSKMKDRISEHIINMRIVEEFGIPHPDKWDWRRAATISYLYNVNSYDVEKTNDKPDLVRF